MRGLHHGRPVALPEPVSEQRPALGLIIGAYLALYVVWGSTYLAMAFAIASIPTFVMGSVRLLVAGGLLYGCERLRGTPAPTLKAWGSALVVGILLFAIGNGLVLRAELSVPSGIAALVLAITQVWMTVMPWWLGGPRPVIRVWIGIAGGLAGVTVLMLPGSLASLGSDHLAVLIGIGQLLIASLGWTAGSLWGKRLPLPASVTMSSSLQMLGGGVAMGFCGLVLGQCRGFSVTQVTLASWEAFAYLVLIGSIVGFGAFVYLMRWSRPHTVATYAVVNPLVAILLGWMWHGETPGPSTWIATAMIVASVGVILMPSRTFCSGEPHQAAPPSNAPPALPPGNK